MKGFEQIRSNLNHSIEQNHLLEAKNYTSKMDTRTKPGYDDKTDKQIPTVVTMQRKAIRQYPNNQKIALYYAQSIDKYISIPFGKDDDSGPATVKEEHINEANVRTVTSADIVKYINQLHQSNQTKSAVKLAVDHIQNKGNVDDVSPDVLSHPDVQQALNARQEAAKRKKQPQVQAQPQAAPQPAPAVNQTQQRTSGTTTGTFGPSQKSYNVSTKLAPAPAAAPTAQQQPDSFSSLHANLQDLHTKHQELAKIPQRKHTPEHIAQMAALASMKNDVYRRMAGMKDLGGISQLPGIGDTTGMNPKAAVSGLKVFHDEDIKNIRQKTEDQDNNRVSKKFFAPLTHSGDPFFTAGEIGGRAIGAGIIGISRLIKSSGKKVMNLKEQEEIKDRFRKKLQEKRELNEISASDVADTAAELTVPYYSAVKNFKKGRYIRGAIDAATDTGLLALSVPSLGGSWAARIGLKGLEKAGSAALEKVTTSTAEKALGSAGEKAAGEAAGKVAGSTTEKAAGEAAGSAAGAATTPRIPSGPTGPKSPDPSRGPWGPRPPNTPKVPKKGGGWVDKLSDFAGNLLGGQQGGGRPPTQREIEAEFTTQHKVQPFGSEIGGGRLAGQAQLSTASKSDMPLDPSSIPVTAQKRMSQGWARQAMSENVIKEIRKVRMKNLAEATLFINEEPVTINNNLAEKILTVHKSLNRENKQRFESMLNENVETFKKAVNFALRH